MTDKKTELTALQLVERTAAFESRGSRAVLIVISALRQYRALVQTCSCDVQARISAEEIETLPAEEAD